VGRPQRALCVLKPHPGPLFHPATTFSHTLLFRRTSFRIVSIETSPPPTPPVPLAPLSANPPFTSCCLGLFGKLSSESGRCTFLLRKHAPGGFFFVWCKRVYRHDPLVVMPGSCRSGLSCFFFFSSCSFRLVRCAGVVLTSVCPTFF